MMTNGDEAHWFSEHLGNILTISVVAATIISSWAIAQYQIMELRSSVNEINRKIELLPPFAEWQYRIQAVETVILRNEKATNELVGDVREIMVILDRIEKGK